MPRGCAANLLDGHLIVPAFPAFRILPIKREQDLAANRKIVCRKIQMLQIPAALLGVVVM